MNLSELGASAVMPLPGQPTPKPHPIPKPRPQPTVQSRAAQLEAELAALRQLEGVISSIRSVKRRFPQLFEDFVRQLQSAIDDDPTEQELEAANAPDDAPTDTVTGIEKLEAIFRANNNEPMTVKQMAKAIGLRDMTIKSILYERHRSKFVTVERRGKRNEAYFCLAEA